MIAATALTFAGSLALMLFYPDAILRIVAGGSALSFQIDGFRALYGCVTGFLWTVTALFSPEYFADSSGVNRYWLFNMLTLGATMGVFYSADLLTTFLFFEIMSLTSYAMVTHDESPAALRAGETYLAIAVMGGLAILMGMMQLWQLTGTLTFTELYRTCSAMSDRSVLYLPGALMLAGFGAKAGMFPLHIWLPEAHPVAPAPASALLSGILTKTGVFGVIVVSRNLFPDDYAWGVGLLTLAGVTMVLGAILGLFSIDLKRTLACSSVSQIGFILMGAAISCLIGDYNGYVIGGTVLHMLNHSLIKLVLFVSAGIVYINLHELNLNKIRGFGHGKPLFMFSFVMGALSIGGIPLWSGYVSKTLLHKGILAGIDRYAGLPLEASLKMLDAAFILTGGLTVAYMTKLFVALFVEIGDGAKKTTKDSPYVSRHTAFALVGSAVLLPFLGSFTSRMDALAARGYGFINGNKPYSSVSYFAVGNIKDAVTCVIIGAAVYVVVVRGLLMQKDESGAKVYIDRWPKWLNLENHLYRPLLNTISWVALFLARAAASAPDALMRLTLRTLLRTNRRSYIPGKFLSGHYDLFHRWRQPVTEEPAVVGSFSNGLLLIGLGACIMLLCLFFNAL